MENKILLALIFGLALTASNVDTIEKQLVSVFSHYDLESSSKIERGRSLTFTHKGDGAEHMIDINITEDNGNISLLFHNAKFDKLSKSFNFQQDLFTAHTPAYVELVYRMARTRSEDGKVYFTNLDDLFAEINNISSSYTTSMLPPEDGEFKFEVKSKNSNVMLVTAKINKVESENIDIIEENYQVNLDMVFSNNNKIEKKKHSFLMFGKKDFSFLKQILEKGKVENSYDVINALQDAYKGNSNVSFGKTFTNVQKNVLIILFYSKVALLVEVSQNEEDVTKLSTFTIKLGKLPSTYSTEDNTDLSVDHPLYKLENFLRCDSKFIKDGVANWDLSKASESFDHIILTVYKKLHETYYESIFKGATLGKLKESSFGDFFNQVKTGFGITNTVPIIAVQTNYEGKVLAKFQVTEGKNQAHLNFRNDKLQQDFNVSIPITAITAELVRSYIEPAFVSTREKLIQQVKQKKI